MTVISSFLTFPNISWWKLILEAELVMLDAGEHFQKMTSRNRYDISGANNPVKLSVPLVNGRNQHIPMGQVCIFNGETWQTRHWRTLVSVYKRTPYFDHYAPGLQQLFTAEYHQLISFNRASIEWVMKQLLLKFEIEEASVYVKEYPEHIKDLRNFKNNKLETPRYYQVFEDRVGFLPDLSILDLLFSEGPGAITRLKR